MIESYVTALNTPGMVPNVQKAWDVFVATKCTQAKSKSIALYDEMMASEISGTMPCKNDVIRHAQMVAHDRALKLFEENTLGISRTDIEKYLHELTVRKIPRHSAKRTMNIERWQNILLLQIGNKKSFKKQLKELKLISDHHFIKEFSTVLCQIHFIIRPGYRPRNLPL